MENHDNPENVETVAELFSESTGLKTDSSEKVLKAVKVYNMVAEVIPFVKSRSQNLI